MVDYAHAENYRSHFLIAKNRIIHSINGYPGYFIIWRKPELDMRYENQESRTKNQDDKEKVKRQKYKVLTFTLETSERQETTPQRLNIHLSIFIQNSTIARTMNLFPGLPAFIL